MITIIDQGYGQLRAEIAVSDEQAASAYRRIRAERFVVDYDEIRLAACAELNDGTGIYVEEGKVGVVFQATHEDPSDALDGTLAYPTAPSLDDRLKIAFLVRGLIGGEA